MRSSRSVLVVVIGILSSACGGASAPPQGLAACYLQDTPLDSAVVRPSPLGATTITLGGDEATLCYSRPSARGRTVMGGLVPYGEPWRMGANEATAIHLPFAAAIGTALVEPGNYSLYAVPGAEDWTVAVNRIAERWGIPISDAVKRADVSSFQVPVTTTDDMVEQLTYAWVSDGPDTGRIVMTWEHARLEIPVRRVGS